MRLYVTPAGRWAGTQAEAKQLAREEGSGWEQVDVPTDKEGLLSFLDSHRVNAMHGEARAMIDAGRIEPAEPVQERPTRSLSLEDEWEALPLPLQLHYAALALERARDEIKPGRGQ
jgi:hypothetical protein